MDYVVEYIVFRKKVKREKHSTDIVEVLKKSCLTVYCKLLVCKVVLKCGILLVKQFG